MNYLTFSFSKKTLERVGNIISQKTFFFVIMLLTALSVSSFVLYYRDGLGLSYNDARSHLDIGRRVVEGLKPGLAQIGSVWLPLPHLLMVPTIWNDFMWHTGLSGALQSMISFVATGALVYLFLQRLKVGWVGRIIGVLVFVGNLNVLYLQSTAMTEMLLLSTMTAGCYFLLVWQQKQKVLDLILAAFFIMLSTLVRYDGWFLFLFAGLLVLINTFKNKGLRPAEGTSFLYATLAGFGVVLWFFWNAAIFKDPLYFAFGPFSAHAQQQQLETAGVLSTKGNMLLSLKIYLYALLYNSYASIVILGTLGGILFWLDKKFSVEVRIITLSLLAPLIFNIIALYFGHSVLFIQGVSGNTWFNVRYGIMLAPSIAIFCGYLVHRMKDVRWVFIGLIALTLLFAFMNGDAVTIDDARVGSSQKNVSEVSGWLQSNVSTKDGFVLVSVASHDAILFSSGLPMRRFIHEGTGAYWDRAIANPDQWARWIIMRTNDTNDLTFKLIQNNPARSKYTLVKSFPFADIYEIQDQYLPELHLQPIAGLQ